MANIVRSGHWSDTSAIFRATSGVATSTSNTPGIRTVEVLDQRINGVGVALHAELFKTAERRDKALSEKPYGRIDLDLEHGVGPLNVWRRAR